MYVKKQRTSQCARCGIIFQRRIKPRAHCDACSPVVRKEKALARRLAKGTKRCDWKGCDSMKLLPIDQKFCSKRCVNYAVIWKTQPTKSVVCNACGTTYTHMKPISHTKKACSRQCANELKRRGRLGKSSSDETRAKLRELRLGTKLSYEHRRAIGDGCSREKNGRWIDGRSLIPDEVAYFNFSRARKRDVRIRDGGCCRVCSDKKQLAIHHIDGDKKNDSDENFITLCFSCHSRVHGTNPPIKGDIGLFYELKEKLK